jgi:hypothetical protein
LFTIEPMCRQFGTASGISMAATDTASGKCSRCATPQMITGSEATIRMLVNR